MSTLQTKIALRNDTAAKWESVNPILLSGEIGIETDTNLFKIGDGSSSWNDLQYANDAKNASHYQGELQEGETDAEAIERVMSGISPNQDDIFILKKTISGTKKQYASYVFDGENWIPLDLNYDASNVYFDKDFTVTEKIGTIQTLTNGTATLSAAGKSVKEVLSALFAAEKYPVKPTPTAAITLSNAGTYEVGTTVSPTYSVSFDKKSYTYGPTVQITPSAYSVSDGNTTKTTATGTFDEITVGDGTNYKLTATVEYPADTAIPVTNLGNEYAAAQITAGSASATSSAITGYRQSFYGILDTSSADEPLTSAILRGSTISRFNYNGAKTLSLAAASHNGAAKRFFVAVPNSSTRGGLSEVLLTSTMNLDITTSYARATNVEVEGANGYAAVAYKVWVYEPDKIGTDEVHQIKLA